MWSRGGAGGRAEGTKVSGKNKNKGHISGTSWVARTVLSTHFTLTTLCTLIIRFQRRGYPGAERVIACPGHTARERWSWDSNPGDHALSYYTVDASAGAGPRGISPFWMPGMRVVLKIFSYWAEHKGRIPISKVCKRPRAPELPPRTRVAPRPQDRSLRVRPTGRPSYRQDLLAVQAVAVEEEGVDRVPSASGLHRRGSDVQEVLGASRGDRKAPGVRRAPHGDTDPQTQILTPTEGGMGNHRLRFGSRPRSSTSYRDIPTLDP